MALFLAVVVFIGLLLILVLVHEWGHFIVAKKAGCNVEEFGFGFPPRLWSFVKGGTRYSLNLLPLGGFVKIEGENMAEASSAPTNFASKKPWVRIAILSAGVVMNIVLAAVLLTVQSAVGAPTIVTETNSAALADKYTYIVEITKDSPAEQAGIEAFDRIVQVQNVQNPTVEDVQKITREEAGQPLTLELERQGLHLTKTLTPRLNPPEGQGALGVSLAATGLEKLPLWQAPIAGIKKTGQMLISIVDQFWQLLVRLFHQQGVGQNLTGPIGIAVYSSEVTKLGLGYFLEFAALISLNLAIINILPIPALDGGRIVFVLLESVIARKALQKVENYVHTAGFAVLIVLMIIITLRDIHRYF